MGNEQNKPKQDDPNKPKQDDPSKPNVDEDKPDQDPGKPPGGAPTQR